MVSADNAWAEFERELREVASEYEVCVERNLVLGEGNRRAEIALIGEAPGAQEDRARRPFVGPAGRLLDRALEEVGIARDLVWITNVVKCRPTNVMNGRLSNRPPRKAEFDQFLPWLERELRLVEPRAIVSLGATAAKALLGRSTVRMGDLRGQWIEGVLGIDTLITYHPSYLLRDFPQREERHAEFVADLLLARQRLGER
jgi:uracil-DNA glycosylase